jgi:hypothetical protein
MAREPKKSERESGKAKTEDASSSAGAKASASSASKASGSAAGSRWQETSGSDIGEYQIERQRELLAVLAMRSVETPNVPAIAKKFAAIWLPHHMTEAEVLVPALEDAAVDEEKMAAVKVRKDVLNLLLTGLLETETAEFAKAKLDALSDAFDAVMSASNAERESLLESGGEGMRRLGPQARARYERLKERFADLDENIGEAMELLSPRSLPPSPSAPATSKGA